MRGSDSDCHVGMRRLVSVCVTPPRSRQDHTSLTAQAHRNIHTHWDILISTLAWHAYALPSNMQANTHTNIHTGWHRDSVFICGAVAWQESIFILFNTQPFPWHCSLAWPEPYAHRLSRSIPWACGTTSHKNHRSLVHCWLAQRACVDSEAQPEVERSWKSSGLRASQRHKCTRSFPKCTGIQLLLIWPWSEESPPSQVTQVKLVRLL